MPPATTHTTLAGSPLRSITRRNPPASGCAVAFHYITRRTVGMARGATRGTSLYYTSLLPSRLRHTLAVARSTRKHSPNRCKHPPWQCHKEFHRTMCQEIADTHFLLCRTSPIWQEISVGLFYRHRYDTKILGQPSYVG